MVLAALGSRLSWYLRPASALDGRSIRPVHSLFGASRGMRCGRTKQLARQQPYTTYVTPSEVSTGYGRQWHRRRHALLRHSLLSFSDLGFDSDGSDFDKDDMDGLGSRPYRNVHDGAEWC